MRSFAIVSLLAALIAASPLETIVKRDTCVNGNFQAGNQICQMRCQTDMPGGNERTVLQTTRQSCAEACAADAACIVAQRDSTNGNCYLKLSITQYTSNPQIDTVVCQNACVSGSRQIQGRTCNVTCGSDRNGPSYKQTSAVNTNDCGNQCANDPACISSTFWSGHCYLKSTQYTLTSNSNVDVVDCPNANQAQAPAAIIP